MSQTRRSEMPRHRPCLLDIAETGFWPSTHVSEPAPAPTQLHWHRFEVHGYGTRGMTWVLDGETGDRLVVELGGAAAPRPDTSLPPTRHLA